MVGSRAMRRVATATVLCLAPGMAAAQGRDTAVYDVTDGIRPPVVLRSVKPSYTQQARAARVQGVVIVKAVVLADGTVGDVTPGESTVWPYLGTPARDRSSVTPLSPQEVAKLGLNRQAVEAAKQWTFKPGTKDGKPVAVRVTLELTFALGPAKTAR